MIFSEALFDAAQASLMLTSTQRFAAEGFPADPLRSLLCQSERICATQLFTRADAYADKG